MPFLRDEGPPISPASIQKFRESLPNEYGWQVVNETGREVLVVRVPKAKPDYLHDLAEVAFYVGLETIRSTKDVLLVGHEKTARLEPQLLRDHIRAQGREDATVVDHLRRSLDRQYGHTFVQSPSNHLHNAFCVRIPKETVALFTPDDVTAIRQLFASLRARVMDCQYAYIIANSDHERLGRRTLMELIGEGAAPAAEPAAASAPVDVPVITAPAAAPPAPRTPFPSMFPTAAPTAASIPAAASMASAPKPVASAAPSPAAPAVLARIAAGLSAPAQPTSPPAAEPAAEVADTEEYTIVSKPKAAPAPVAPMVAPAPAVPEADVSGNDEYEVVSKPKAPAPVEAPVAEEPVEDAPEKNVIHADKEFEVFTSKPKPRPADSAPAITPPGMGGFMAAINNSATPAPARTREYEIIGRTSVTSDPSIVSRMKLPGAHAPAPAASPFAPAAPAAHVSPAEMQAAPVSFFHPAPAAAPRAPPAEPVTAIPPRVATPAASQDNGAPIVGRVTLVAPELVLAQRFRESGYEIVEGLRAQGTVFAFAAHRPNGRRVLVKRSDSFAADDAVALSQLVAALGADVALVVADDIKPGTRIATWGTRIEVVTPADVPSLSF